MLYNYKFLVYGGFFFRPICHGMHHMYLPDHHFGVMEFRLLSIQLLFGHFGRRHIRRVVGRELPRNILLLCGNIVATCDHDKRSDIFNIPYTSTRCYPEVVQRLFVFKIKLTIYNDSPPELTLIDSKRKEMCLCIKRVLNIQQRIFPGDGSQMLCHIESRSSQPQGEPFQFRQTCIVKERK